MSDLTYRLARGALLGLLLAIAMLTGQHWAFVAVLLFLVCVAL